MLDQQERYTRRESGLLIPSRAMPGDDDHQGTLGEESVAFLELMQKAGFSILHDLPNNPPDGFDCPYSSVSAFALDSRRIDFEKLVEAGDITRDELECYQILVSSGDAGSAIKSEKTELLKHAFKHFDNSGSPERKAAFAEWRNKEADWLDSYVAFEILKNLPGNANKRWQDWEDGKDYSPTLVAKLKSINELEFSAVCYTQWIAEEQTLRFLDKAKQFGLEVWGDVPFYVGDGEVWANRDLFNLDTYGNKLSQGGAPPSATSETGQLWGHATYKFSPENNQKDNDEVINWWVKRLERAIHLNNGKIRLDHFIGFAEPYIIPANATDGMNGWRDVGIGRMLFGKLVNRFGEKLPFYPEDLGTMTDITPQMRIDFGLPTNILAVRGITKDAINGNYDKSSSNPDNYPKETVGFSGNHDTRPLIQALDETRSTHPEAIALYIDHLNRQSPGRNLNRRSSSAEIAQIEMERLVHSVGQVAILAIWDCLGLGEKARYNIPATTSSSNWSWRMTSEDVQKFRQQIPDLRELNASSNRSLQLTN